MVASSLGSRSRTHNWFRTRVAGAKHADKKKAPPKRGKVRGALLVVVHPCDAAQHPEASSD